MYITALENEAYKFLHPDNTVICQVGRSRASIAEFEEEAEEAVEEGTEETAEATSEAQE